MNALIHYLVDLVSRAGHWSYALLFAAACLESAAFLGLFVPGESIVLAAGFLAAQRVLDLDILIACVALGAVVGDSVGYELGRRLGEPALVQGIGPIRLGAERMARARAFLDRHGGKAVFLGRFVGFARALVPFLAGSGHLRYSRFLAANIAGATVWAPAVAIAGYLLGASWNVAERWMGRATLLVAGVLGLAFAIAWMARWVGRHEHAVRQVVKALDRHGWIEALSARVARLKPPVLAKVPWIGRLGVRFFVGITILVGAAWVFGVLAEDVSDGDAITKVDLLLGRWLVDHREPWLVQAATVVSGMHDAMPVVLLTLGTGLWLLSRGQFGWFWSLLLTVPGGMAVNFLEKIVFQRSRPDFGPMLDATLTYSFPSGHTAAATLLYGWIALYVTRDKIWSEQVFAAAIAGGLAVMVAISRMVLGLHYLTDVLAAVAVAATWLLLVWSGTQWWLARTPPAKV